MTQKAASRCIVRLVLTCPKCNTQAVLDRPTFEHRDSVLIRCRICYRWTDCSFARLQRFSKQTRSRHQLKEAEE